MSILARPPSYPVRLAKGNPLTRGLQIAVAVMGGHPYVVTPRFAAPMLRVGSALVGGARGPNTGQGMYLGSAGDRFDFAGMPPANAVTDAITWFALALTGVSSTTDKITLAFSGSGLTVGNIAFGNGTDTALNCYARTSSSAFPQRIAASAPYAINTRYFVAGSRTTAQSYPDMYLDGVLSNGTGYSPGTGNLAASVTNVSMNNGSAALTGVTYCGGLFNRTLSAYEHLLLARNPWQIFERADKPVFYSLPSGGATVSASVGNAVAAGATANISAGTTINAGIANAVAAGATANISAGTTINASVGNAVAEGAQASITSGTTLDCTVGNAVAAGAQATISAGTTINAGVGNAVAAGVQASITTGFTLECTVGNAVAAGVQAGISIGSGTVTIACAVGNAVAAGVDVDIWSADPLLPRSRRIGGEILQAADDDVVARAPSRRIGGSVLRKPA